MIDPWYLENLVCPKTGTLLTLEGENLVSKKGQVYPVIDGIPIMLVEENDSTIWLIGESLRRAKQGIADKRAPNWYIESLGITDSEKEELIHLLEHPTENMVDPVVSMLIGATNGIAFRHLQGHLKEYPIPKIPFNQAGAGSLCDIGCSWGRWCIAAAKMGFNPVIGLDPSLGAIMASRRVAKALGISTIKWVVGDARYLPFKCGIFDTVFSYGVLQHFSVEHVRMTLAEVSRVLKPEGTTLVQMAQKFGVRSLYHQAKRKFRKAQKFEVRYWHPKKLVETFETYLGPTIKRADCFLGLGLRWENFHLMTVTLKIVLVVSKILELISWKFKPLVFFADSVWLWSTRAMKVGSKKSNKNP